MENNKRNHITTIFDDIVSSLKAWIVPLLLILFTSSGKEKPGFITRYLSAAATKYAVLIFILLLIFGISFLRWYRKSFMLKDGFIIINEGIFIRNRREIPVNKIQTINLSQNVMQKFFKTAALKIDTGNSSIKDAEVSIIIKKAEAEQLKNSISSIIHQQSDNVSLPSDEPCASSVEASQAAITASCSVTTGELAAAGLTSNSLPAGIAFLASAYALLDDFADFIGNKIDSWFLPYAQSYDLKSMPAAQIITYALIIFAVYLIFSSAVSIVNSIIKYYGFTVKRQGDELLIKYGLFNTRSYVIPVKKIKVVYMKQSLIRQLFGIESLHVESVGYGNEKGESSVIYPIAGKVKGKELLFRLLPEFEFNEEMIRVPRKSLRRFIISSTLFPLIICTALSFIFRSYGYASFLAIPVFVLMGILEYRNSASASNDSLICISSKGFLKTIALLKIEGIQSVTQSANYFQRRKGLFNLTLSIQSNSFGTAVNVKNLDSSLKQSYQDILKTPL